MPQAVQLYCYPAVQCRAGEHFQDGVATSGRIVVPYRAVPVPANAPHRVPRGFSPEWEEWFGCSECGAVRSYSTRDIQWDTMQKPDLADYPSPGNFYSVQAPCQAEACDRRLFFVVDMKAASVDELEAKLRRGFFYGMWSCGHRLLPIKDNVLVRRIASLPSRPSAALRTCAIAL